MKTYTSYQSDIVRIINNADSDNILWATEVINDSLRYLTTRYYFNERSYNPPGGTIAQQQFYNLPPQVKNLINVTVNVGNVLWQPIECPTRQYWDSLNAIQYYQDFPSNFFVFNGQVGIFPTPSSSGNEITMNYKTRVPDLTQADVTSTSAVTTVAITSNSMTVTASGPTFLNWMVGQWIRIPFSNNNTTSGDDQWYQIASVTSSTILVLMNPYTGNTISGAAFTIGQTPLLPEDYQDLPLYRMGIIYYTTRFPDPTRAQLYQKLWDDGFAALDQEFGTKTTNVVLNDTTLTPLNPNLFQSGITQAP